VKEERKKGKKKERKQQIPWPLVRKRTTPTDRPRRPAK
jgi:hypothetical protein